MDVNNNKEKDITVLVTTLASLGVIIVIILVFVALLTDRRINDNDKGKQDDVNVEQTQDSDYGISFIDLPNGYVFKDNKEEGNIVDCRKYSAQYREEQLSQGMSCYKITIQKAGEDYIDVITGDGNVVDPYEKYIEVDGEKIYPTSKLNLPLVRMEISDFPTNLSGIGITYPNVNYTFYRGVVYKGADKYTINIHGEVNDQIKELLDTITLD